MMLITSVNQLDSHGSSDSSSSSSSSGSSGNTRNSIYSDVFVLNLYLNKTEFDKIDDRYEKSVFCTEAF